MKTGIVMEGGAMRGMFTAGVLDVMMEEGLTFDGAVGVSAGATFGCNLKSRQIGRAIRYNKTYCKDNRYCSWESLIRTGDLYGVDFCYRELPYELDKFDTETFQANPMPFYVVATDLETGRAVYKRIDRGDGEDMKWFVASASMPLVSHISEIDGRKLLDGGMADSIPLRYMEYKGYERNVVVLTQPRGFVKQPNKQLPLIRILLHQYPNVIRTIKNRHIMYNKTTEYIFEREGEGAAFVIAPPQALNIGPICHNPDELQRVYDIGRKTMEERMEELKAFMS
ncbi:MAG: patatin-like phospholipase family protein [Lachnospiraceae bacterium]